MNGDSAGIRLGHCRVVERCLEVSSEAIVGGLIRPRHACGRHRPSPKLADHLFPHLRTFRYIRDVHLTEHKSRGMQLLVVADDAVLVENRPVGCGGRRIGTRRAARNRDSAVLRQCLHGLFIVFTRSRRSHRRVALGRSSFENRGGPTKHHCRQQCRYCDRCWSWPTRLRHSNRREESQGRSYILRRGIIGHRRTSAKGTLNMSRKITSAT